MINQFDIKKYQEYFANKHDTIPDNIEISYITEVSNGRVRVKYKNNSEIKIERIRRVTGYLSNTNNWNNAKQSEEKDRIKHT